MKNNKLRLLILGLVVLIGLVACAPADRNLDNRNRRLSNQTRIGDNNNRWNTGTNTLDRNRTSLGPDNTMDGNNRLGQDNILNRDNQFGQNDLMDRDNQFGQNNMMDRDGLMGQNNIMDGNIGLRDGSNNDFNNNLNNGMTRPNQNNNLATNVGNKSNNDTADLSRKISDLPEVDKASVVINNDTAVIGCKLRGNTQGTMTTALRDKIQRIVKDTNSNIKNVSITTDPNLYNRIRTMSSDIERGNPVRGLADEIKDLIRRISPNSNTSR